MTEICSSPTCRHTQGDHNPSCSVCDCKGFVKAPPQQPTNQQQSGGQEYKPRKKGLANMSTTELLVIFIAGMSVLILVLMGAIYAQGTTSQKTLNGLPISLGKIGNSTELKISNSSNRSSLAISSALNGFGVTLSSDLGASNQNQSKGFAGVNLNISKLSYNQSHQNTPSLNGLPSNISSINKNLSTVIHLDDQILNKTYNITSTGSNAITIYPSSQGSSGGYITGYLFAGFHTHILLNVSESATFAVYQFSTFTPSGNSNQQLQFTQWCSTQTSSANGINIWWNYTQQTDQNFVYVVYNTTSQFTVGTNSIARYNDSGSNRESC